jgi:DNA-binding NarL/FixJ family response regulator
MSVNILIVDDSATMRRMIRRTLQMSGLDIDTVHEAENGIKAFAVLGQSEIDAIILDVNAIGFVRKPPVPFGAGFVNNSVKFWSRLWEVQLGQTKLDLMKAMTRPSSQEAAFRSNIKLS